MLTVSFTQSGSLVKKWSPRSRTAIVWVTRGDFHLSACALSLQDISKRGLPFPFLRGGRVCQISGRSSDIGTLESRKSTVAFRSQRSA